MSSDCYVLTHKRSKDFIWKFLDTFIPHREECSSVYEFPRYSVEATRTFETAGDIIDFLVENINEPYAIYWNNVEDSKLQTGMCFFTDDGMLIVGLSTATMYPDTSIEDKVLQRLKDFCGSEEGYITYEDPAPDSAKEFRELIERKKSQNNRS